MKNKILKRSHLTEKKCREIVQLFSEDLTATQIANITGVSRVTINNYLKLIRTHIAKYCEEQNPRYHNRNIIPFVVLRKSNGQGQAQEGEDTPNTHYGFFRYNGNIFVDWLYDIDKANIIDLQRSRMHNGTDVKSNNELMKYHAIADFDSWKLYRIDTSNTVNGKSHIDDISVFWGNTKSRLLKFRGLNKNTLYLHVKECEFRYNHRNNDINAILLGIIYKRPLHFSKTFS